MPVSAKSFAALKVLHVVHSLEPGGMENGLVNLTHGLQHRGISMHFACLERRGAFAEKLPAPMQLEILGKGRRFSAKATLNLARRISRVRPQVVHTHNLGPLIYGALATFFGTRCHCCTASIASSRWRNWRRDGCASGASCIAPAGGCTPFPMASATNCWSCIFLQRKSRPFRTVWIAYASLRPTGCRLRKARAAHRCCAHRHLRPIWPA